MTALAWALLAIAIVGTVSSSVYLALVLIAAARFRRAARPAAVFTPPVTLLKPVHGLEPLLEESLESFFAQDYPEFELIFGARHADNPALQIVDELRRKYPQVPVTVVLSGEPTAPNAKVCSLEKMVAAARHDLLIISDSDVRVARDYIREVVAPFADPQVGAVTCLYRGVPTGGLWSRLEALGMSVEMASGVLVANLLEGMRFTLGPTMAVRRGVLEQMGGMPALADYCADDFVLGQRAAELGHRVVLSHHVIDHIVLGRDLRSTLAHQVRWMKSTRYSRPSGHIGSGLTFAIPFALLALAAGAVSGSWTLPLALFAWGVVNRVIQALAIGWGVLRDSHARDFAWLYPARDLLGFLVWAASFTGNTIEWRGERYRLLRGGKMARL